MKTISWLSKRAAELSEQLRQEALLVGAIDSTKTVLCELKIVNSAPTQLKIEELKKEFGYEDVIIYPEGLSVAQVSIEAGSVNRPRAEKRYFHILTNGKPAYDHQHKYAGPFIRGHAVVSSQGFGIGAKDHYYHIYPNGEDVYPYNPKYHIIQASPFSKEGVADVIVETNSGEISCLMDLGGNIKENKKQKNFPSKKSLKP